MFKALLKKFFNKNEPDMVQYWKTKTAVEAKLTLDKHGSYIMYMEGEKYPFPGYPRGVVLYKALSKLKHEIKNQIFNDSWLKLDQGEEDEKVIGDIKETLFSKIKELMEERRLLLLPPHRMAVMPRELWRAMTAIEKRHTAKEAEKIKTLKEILCFIAQEDDAYRFRIQWIMRFMKPALWFGKKNCLRTFDYALSLLEHAEIVGDMKERQRLLRRILMLTLKDEKIRSLFLELCQEWDWEKMKLSKADAYFFRGKWFKVDYPQNQY